MNLSTRLDYLRPANLRLRLRQTHPALRSPPKAPAKRHPRSGRFVSVSVRRPRIPYRNGPSKTKRPVRHRFAPIRLPFTFEALRRDGADRADLEFALAGCVCATRTRGSKRPVKTCLIDVPQAQPSQAPPRFDQASCCGTTSAGPVSSVDAADDGRCLQDSACPCRSAFRITFFFSL